MSYRRFREIYRKAFNRDPLEAFKLFRKWWPIYGAMSPKLDTQAVLAFYENEPAIHLLQEQATYMRKS